MPRIICASQELEEGDGAGSRVVGRKPEGAGMAGNRGSGTGIGIGYDEELPVITGGSPGQTSWMTGGRKLAKKVLFGVLGSGADLAS